MNPREWIQQAVGRCLRLFYRKEHFLITSRGAADAYRGVLLNGSGVVDDSMLDLADYALLPGRSGGQHLRGGTASGEDLTLESTSHTTKGDVILQPNGGTVVVGEDLKINSNWLLQSETEDGVERLTIKAVGANDAAELFLHPTGSADTSRVTITDAVNQTNYEGIAVEATATENTIESVKAGTGTAQPLKFKMDGADVITIATDDTVGINRAPTAGVDLDVNGPLSTRAELILAGSIATPGRSAFVYRPADNKLGLGTNSVERVRIDDSGGVAIGSSDPTTDAKLDIQGTDGALLVPRLTTTQRNALTPSAGMIIFNTTTAAVEAYVGAAWVDVVVSRALYALLAGRSGGQTLRGGTDAGDDLTLDSTAHATKGYVLINPSGGEVGVGRTPSGGINLDVNGTLMTRAELAFGGNASTPSRSAFVYRPATNELGLGTNSAERLHIDSAGVVTAHGDLVVEGGAQLGDQDSDSHEIYGSITSSQWSMDSGGTLTTDGEVAFEDSATAIGEIAGYAGSGSAPATGMGGLNLIPEAGYPVVIASNSHGLVLPRLTTTQRNSISSAPDGCLIYNTSTNKVQARAGGSWVDLH